MALRGRAYRASPDRSIHDAAIAGVRALKAAGIPIEISLAIVRSSRDMLPGVPVDIARRLGDLKGIHAFVIRVPLQSPIQSELLSYEESAGVIQRFERAAR